MMKSTLTLEAFYLFYKDQDSVDIVMDGEGSLPQKPKETLKATSKPLVGLPIPKHGI